MPLFFRISPSNIDNRLQALLMAPDGIVTEDTRRRARNVSAKARQLARERSVDTTGALPGSIRYEVRSSFGFSVVARVGSDLKHALWVEQGTGIFGPHHTPIIPTQAKFLRFKPHGSESIILARSVRGQPGKHFLRDALSAANL